VQALNRGWKAFQSGGSPTIKLELGGQNYTINFDDMEQCNDVRSPRPQPPLAVSLAAVAAHGSDAGWCALQESGFTRNMRRKAKPAEPKPQPKPAKKPSPARATVKTEGKQQGARASGGKAKVTVVPKADTKKKAPAKAKGGGGGGGGNPNWGPKAPPLAGMKHIPRGAPGCLRGKSFLVSGTLESLDRQDAFALIEKYGGSIIKSVPKKKKLDYAVIGEEAGQSKIKQLEDRNIPQIDENGLLTLIRDSLPPDERAKEPEVGDLKEDMELEGGLASAGGVKKPRAAAAAARPSPSSAAAPAAAAAAAAAPKPAPPDPKHLLWTEKHKPRTHKDLIGNFNRALPTPCRAGQPSPARSLSHISSCRSDQQTEWLDEKVGSGRHTGARLS